MNEWVSQEAGKGAIESAILHYAQDGKEFYDFYDRIDECKRVLGVKEMKSLDLWDSKRLADGFEKLQKHIAVSNIQ